VSWERGGKDPLTPVSFPEDRGDISSSGISFSFARSVILLTAMFHFTHYWVVPIFSGFVWLGMLLGMLLWWTVKEHSVHLAPMAPNQHIALVLIIFSH
jgi:hypothetical protein